jgi:hypothetical protein
MCALSVGACNDATSRGASDADAESHGEASAHAEHVAACQRLFASDLALPESGPSPRFQADLVPFFTTHCNFGACHLGSGSTSQLQLGAECRFNVRTSECIVDADAASPVLARDVYDNLLAPTITAPRLRRVDPGKVGSSFILLKLSGCQDAFEPLTGCAQCGQSMPGGAVLRDSEPALFDMVAQWIRGGAPFD